ncbi:MAG: CerR family C-terminal domain-containing protein [Acidobacteriota bacterium]|nr:CerR family C-terminal domain-containing protein [Acidobacteriota bacterium]
MHDANKNEPDTRQKLLDAAARLFAERGFKDVSVREICKEAGGANVAAVNYYFRDKAGLYRELLEQMVEVHWKPDRERLAAAFEGKPPEEKLYMYVRGFIGGLLKDTDEQTMVLQKLLNREMAEPSPEFEVIFKKGMRPNFRMLCEVIGELVRVPPEDQIAIGCANSVMGQCLIYHSARKLSKYFYPGMEFTPAVIDGIARHVVTFSLAGIRAVAQKEPGGKR